MTQTAALYTERPAVAARPTLPGMVRGIVGIDASGPRTVYTLQCERCLEVEKTDILVLMKTKFHSRSPKGQNPRLCPPCRLDVYADCDCHDCGEGRRAGQRVYQMPKKEKL